MSAPGGSPKYSSSAFRCCAAGCEPTDALRRGEATLEGVATGWDERLVFGGLGPEEYFRESHAAAKSGAGRPIANKEAIPISNLHANIPWPVESK